MPPPDQRPSRLLLVTGTGTEVGKTWVAAALARALRATGLSVAPRKPAQSFEPPTTTDATVLAEACGVTAESVCPPHRSYPVALAPPMAAEVLGEKVFTIRDLVDELVWPPRTDVGIVESVGGPRSPLASDGDTITLARELRPDGILLVADAGLGTINAVRLCADVLRPIAPFVVHLNRYVDTDDLHTRNRGWLADNDALHVSTDVDSLAAWFRSLS